MEQPPVLRQAAIAVEHLASVGYIEQLIRLTALPGAWVKLPIVGIAKVDPPTAFLWNTGRQRHRDARRFHAALRVVGARPLHMRAVRQDADASRHALKTLPLLEEIPLDMIAHFVNQLAVCVGNLGDMGSVDDDLATVGNGWLGFVHMALAAVYRSSYISAGAESTWR